MNTFPIRSTVNRLLLPAMGALASILLSASGFSQAHQLIENFTAPLPSSPQFDCTLESNDIKVGLGAAALSYRINPKNRSATLELGDERRVLGSNGVLKLWVKGNNSGHDLELILRHGKPQTGSDGKRTLAAAADMPLPRVKLDFEGWREVTFDVRALPEGNTAWWSKLNLHAPPKIETLDGVIALDDLRFFPEANVPNATCVAGLIGQPVREFTQKLALFLDLRNFTDKPAKLRSRVTMTDRNENLILDREFQTELGPKELKEIALELDPQNLGAFLPPFKITGDVLSSDLQELSTKIDTTLVMGNARYIFDDQGDALSRWFAVGTPSQPRANVRNWIVWTHGEAQRATPLVQTSLRFSRVELGADSKNPPAKYALQLDYEGDAVVYTGAQRYLPGNPYRAGFWIKGDGSGSKLFALFLDYTHGADFYEGGWKRIYDGERELATLDFSDWRYIEVPLPGNGLGSNTANGSTPNIDFPLELTALRIQTPPPVPAPPAATASPVQPQVQGGKILIGPIQIFTQVQPSNALSVQLAYDDAQHRWQPKLGVSVAVQNSSLTGGRKTKENWSILDATGQAVASGQTELSLAEGQPGSFRIELEKFAGELAAKPAPFRVQVTAYDVADGSVSTTTELILTRPECTANVADFETERGYLGLKGREIKTAPGEGEAAAYTSTEQAHGGKRSLQMDWDRDKSPQTFVSIDPALPGIPTELTLWLHGDASGVLFYPLIGDTRGINHGLTNGQWNLFLPKTEGSLQNAVRVDWTGWKKVTFQLPPTAPNWAVATPKQRFLPNYPLGVHLAVDATGVSGERGKLFVDDLSVATHLPVESRVDMIFIRPTESNFYQPGTSLQAAVSNYDNTAPRRVVLSGGIFDWRGNRVTGVDLELQLQPASTQIVDLAKNLPPGFHLLKAFLKEPAAGAKPERIFAELEEDILVTDPAQVLGAQWKEALPDEWELRKPVREKFFFIDEDWDWVEHHPGNLQLDTIRQRARRVSDVGGDPYMLLGYSSFWAAGPGFEQLTSASFQRILRDRGHAVNTFLLPKRLADWDNYVCEVMRGAGKDVSGWVLWDSPDSTGPMGFPAEKFVPFLLSTDKWRRIYCPQRPLLLGGMARETAVPYLQELQKAGGLESIGGVNLRLDVGRLSPEDAGVGDYLRELHQALHPAPSAQKKSVLLTNLDWAVEKGKDGLSAFDQAAYLSRSALLLGKTDIRSALAIRNEDFVRQGLGVAYRRELSCPPLVEKRVTYQLKPAWWAMTRARLWMDQAQTQTEIEVADVVRGRTRCLLQVAADGKSSAVVWRNDDEGALSFAHSGSTVVAAEDIFGAPLQPADGWYPVGKIPCRFTFAVGTQTESLAQSLAKLRVRDGKEALWSQSILATFTPSLSPTKGYAQSGGQTLKTSGRTSTGEVLERSGLNFPSGGKEQLDLPAPAGAGLVLHHFFSLGDTGQESEVFVNGKSAGNWNLKRSDKELSGGLREAVFLLDPSLFAGQANASIEIRYKTPANSTGWQVLEWRGGDFPLSAMGAIHADQNVSSVRFGRNVVGGRLKVDNASYANGIGTFARSLLEFPLNGQFKRFKAKAGIDAVTEGKGSVVFEIFGDGKKLWSSPTVSGLDAAKEIDIDVSGVDRLRLVVGDAGDGNKFDVADWCEPVLQR